MGNLSRCLRFDRIVALLVILTAVAPASPGMVRAQDYPTQPVRIVVPFPPGGPLDFTARAIADHLSLRLKQPVIVDNRSGATGNLGGEIVARAPANGHTLLFTLDTVLTANPWLYKKLPFDPAKDFKPISMVAAFHQMLVVHPSFPASTLTEFVAHARAQPITYGSGGGNGNPGHLTMEHFAQRAGFKATNVPYRGAPQATADLLSGQFLVGYLATPAVLPHVRVGKLKGLAITSLQRARSAPDVPTVAEHGYPEFEVGFYLVLLAPAATPEHVCTLLEREVRLALQSPTLRTRLEEQELTPVGSDGAAATLKLHGIGERWRQVIRSAKIEPE